MVPLSARRTNTSTADEVVDTWGAPSATTVAVAQQHVWAPLSSTQRLSSSLPSLPRGLFGSCFRAFETHAARTFLRTFWQLAARGALLSAHFVLPDAFRRVFALIGKQTCYRLENLGRDRADPPQSPNSLLETAEQPVTRISGTTAARRNSDAARGSEQQSLRTESPNRSAIQSRSAGCFPRQPAWAGPADRGTHESW